MIQPTDITSSFIYGRDNKKKGKILKKYEKALLYEFDYERNKYYSFKVENKNGISKLKAKTDEINYNNLSDTFPDAFVNPSYLCQPNQEPFTSKILHSIKSCVSGSRIRLIDKDFNLDLVFITKRVIAMGFPANNCIEKVYRNDINQVKKFFFQKLHNRVKVYNLCLESNKIYNKCCFNSCDVALYPISDHCCCPVQMMLEFSADACNYLLNLKDSYIAIHCKAGKGRTGSMICAYLIFSGLANSSKEAMDLYAERRSKELKGVTVASQRRYLQHFETFLNLTFQRPFYKQIPIIFRMYSTENSKNNLLHSIFINEANEFFKYGNKFLIKKIKIGPFPYKKSLDISIYSFNKHLLFCSKSFKEHISYKQSIREEQYISDNQILFQHSTIIDFLNEDSLEIESDSEIRVNGQSIDFFLWVNFYYITLEKFNDFIGRQLQNEAMNTKQNSVKSNYEEELNRRKFSDKSKFIESSTSSSIVSAPVNRLLQKSIKLFSSNRYDDYFDCKVKPSNKKEVGFMKTDFSTLHKYELYDRIKKYLDKNTNYLRSDFIQSSDLNSIYNFLSKKFDDEINKDRTFKFSLNSLNFDKYSGESYKDLSLEIIYKLLPTNKN